MKANYLTCIFLASKEKTFLVFTPCSIKKKRPVIVARQGGVCWYYGHFDYRPLNPDPVMKYLYFFPLVKTRNF